MDLTTGIANVVKPIGDINVAGNYIGGVKQGQDYQAKQIENEKARYAQDLQYKLQDAITYSLDANGKPNFDKLVRRAAELGVGKEAIDHVIKTLPAIWQAGADTAAAKTKIAALSPAGEAQLDQSAQSNTGMNSTPAVPQGAVAPVQGAPVAQDGQVPQGRTATQSSSNATAVPVSTVEPANKMNVDLAIDKETGKSSVSLNEQLQDNGLTDEQMKQKAQELDRATQDNKPGFWGTMDTLQVKSPNDTADTVYTKKTGADVSGLPAESKNDLIRGLRAQGIPMPSDKNITPANIDAVIASGMNTVADNTYKGLMKGYNPLDEKTYGVAYSAKSAAGEAIQKAWTDIADKGRDVKTTRLGNASTEQATKQGKIDFDQKQAVVKDAKAEGYGLVNMGNAGTFMEAKAKMNGLQNTLKEISDLRVEGPKLSKDEFNAKVEALLVNPKVAESIGSEAGTARFMESLRKDKSYSQIVADATTFKELVANLAKNEVTAQQQEGILKVIEGMVNSQIKTGVTRGVLDSFKSKAKAGTAKKETAAEIYARLKGKK